ncbi:MAG: ankyrin repeat domain-containing protein [Acidobacteriota bacterium]|nr:ankyrin repeat domain-containing protein [Acidobacteriota bacterium]
MNATSTIGKTALILAAQAGYTAIVMGLLTAGADTDDKDESGVTALIIAQRHNRDEIVKLLK